MKNYYLHKSKKFRKKIGPNKNGAYKYFDFEYIKEPHLSLEDKKEGVINDLRSITEQAGQYPDDVVYKWFENAEALLVVRDEGKNVAFAITNHFHVNIVYFKVTMVIKPYQTRKLGKFIGYYLLRQFYLWRLRKLIFFPEKLFKPFYFIFRTQNPILYYTWSKHLEIYPSFSTDEIPDGIKRVAEHFVKFIWPHSNFDSATFIIKDAYAENPGLRYTPENVPWSKHKDIDSLFERKLELSKDSKDALLLIGKISKFSHHMSLLFRVQY